MPKIYIALKMMESIKNGTLIAGLTLRCTMTMLNPTAMIASTASTGTRYVFGKKLIETTMAPRTALLTRSKSESAAPMI